LIKIAVVGDKRIFDLLSEFGELLISTHFGYLNGNEATKKAADEINYRAIKKML